MSPLGDSGRLITWPHHTMELYNETSALNRFHEIHCVVRITATTINSKRTLLKPMYSIIQPAQIQTRIHCISEPMQCQRHSFPDSQIRTIFHLSCVSCSCVNVADCQWGCGSQSSACLLYSPELMLSTEILRIWPMIYTFHANPVRYDIDLWAPPGDGTQPRVIKLQILLRWDPLDSKSNLIMTKTNDLI